MDIEQMGLVRLLRRQRDEVRWNSDGAWWAVLGRCGRTVGHYRVGG